MGNANGEAITKRYEVRDADTGELIDEPLYVMRPRSDQLAETAMFVYARLCGLDLWGVRQLVAKPKGDWAEWLNDIANIVEPLMKSKSDAYSGLDLRQFANSGPGADGTVEYLLTLLEYIGLEPIDFIAVRLPEDEAEERKALAQKKMREYQDRAHERRVGEVRQMVDFGGYTEEEAWEKVRAGE